MHLSAKILTGIKDSIPQLVNTEAAMVRTVPIMGLTQAFRFTMAISSTQESNKPNLIFKVVLLNSVDFLLQKTSLITSESKLLQSKFNLIFSYKVLDFYKGVPLTL